MDIDVARIPIAWLDGLRHAVAAAPAGERATTAQEALDVVAVVAGLKPAAVVGRGSRDEHLIAAIAAVPVGGLSIDDRPGWPEPVAEVPAWYGALLQAAVGRERLLLVGSVSRRQDWEQLLRDNPDSATVARGLGYPSCCVDEFHRRREGYHHITLRMLARQTAGDVEAMQRLTGAEVMPTPRSKAEFDELLHVTRTVFAPYTSIAMCDACERDPDSPARRIGAKYARLAVFIGFDAWLTGPA